MLINNEVIYTIPAFIIIITYFGNKRLQRYLETLRTKYNLDMHIVKAMKSVIITCSYSIGILLCLENLHIKISALFGTFGVLAVGIGFALQNLLASIVSGILILHYKPYYIGDYVNFTCSEMQRSIEGKIMDINLRETTLEFEGKTIVVPNRILYSCAVIIEKKK